MSDSVQGMTMAETSRLFGEFERRHALFNRNIRGIPYWHLVRFRVYSTVVLPQCAHTGRAHPDFGFSPKKRLSSRLRGLLSRLRIKFVRAWDFIFHNPMTAVAQRDVLISLAPRIVPDPCGGRKIRQVVDPFVGCLKSSYATCEWQFRGTAVTKHNGRGRVFKWSCADAVVAAYRKSADFALLRGEALHEADRLTVEIESTFGVRPEPAILAKSIADALSYAIAAPPVLRKWLKHLHVKCVVVAVAYSFKNFVLVKTAREMGVPTVELQHGTVCTEHVAYNLPVPDSPYTPEWFLMWGAFWAQQMSNYPSRRAIHCGYPYEEAVLVAHPRKEHDIPTVLFISQGTVGLRLSEAAASLCDKMNGFPCRILFKPHPNEMRSWKTLYPALSNPGIEVVDNPSESVYSCFAQSDVIAGVYSTAVIEGFLWGLKAYVFKDMPGADMMSVFCASGAVEYVNSADDLAEKLKIELAGRRTGLSSFDTGEIFKAGAARNVASAIDTIVEKGMS